MFRMRCAPHGAAIAGFVLACCVTPSTALDLQTALAQAVASSPTLEARREMVEAARRRIGPAGAWSSPMVEAGVVNVPIGAPRNSDPMTMNMIGVTQMVPLFGGRGLMRHSATQAYESESAAAEAAHYDLLASTWEAYADAYYAGELARAAESHRDVMERFVQSSRARYEAGNGRLEDVLRADSERARLLADIAAFQAEERSARARLDALRGVRPGTSADSLAAPPLAATPMLAGADSVRLTHPRLRELEAKVSRYELAARAARRETWPDLELRASYGQRGALQGGPDQNDMFSATVGFTVPVFAPARELSEGAEMDAMARAADAERRAVELELREQVEATRAALSGSMRTASLLADTVVVTQKRALDASWSAYTAGTTDLWRVFEAAHTLYSDEVELARTRQEIARLEARWLTLAASGQGLSVKIPEPARDGAENAAGGRSQP